MSNLFFDFLTKKNYKLDFFFSLLHFQIPTFTAAGLNKCSQIFFPAIFFLFVIILVVVIHFGIGIAIKLRRWMYQSWDITPGPSKLEEAVDPCSGPQGPLPEIRVLYLVLFSWENLSGLGFVAAVPGVPVQRLIHTPHPSHLTRVYNQEWIPSTRSSIAELATHTLSSFY